MTNNYVETAASTPPQIYGSPLDGSLTEPPAPLHWRTFELPSTDPDVMAYGAKGVIGWEARIDDLRGGYQQYGDFGRGTNQYDGDYRMTSNSFGVDSRFRRHLLLAQLKTTTTLATAPSQFQVFAVNLNGVLIMGSGSTANFSLFKETSGAPAAVTYTPASNINGLYKGVIGGATNPERLFVCMTGTAIDVHSVAGTSLGSMNAVTSGAWGVTQTPINAATPGTPQLLIGSNNSIYTLPVSSAIGTAPTQVLSGIPNGGWAMGIEQMPKNLPLRAFWAMPRSNQSGTSPGLVKMDIWHTNLEGTDRQQVIFTNLADGVRFADFWRRNVVATDSLRIVTWDGDESRDLHIFNNRNLNSDYRLTVSGLIVNDNNLYAVVTNATFNSSSTATTMWIEQYLPEFDAWIQVSSTWVPTTFSISIDGGVYTFPVVQVHAFSPSTPFSKQTGRVHINMNDTTWNSMLLHPAGQNPYYLTRQTGASQNFAQAWATTGTWTSPYYTLPTLEGRMKKVDQIVFGGAIDEGNVKVTINPNQGGTAVSFAGTDSTRSQPAPTSQTLFDLLQVGIQLNQGSTIYKTPQGLPITLRGRAYMNDANIQSLGLPGGFV
jgi:hypothetical protein